MTDKQQPEALRLAELLTADEWPGHMTLVSYARECVAELRRLHAENETLRTGYAAARLEIESLQSQLHAAKQINTAQFWLLTSSIPGSALRVSHWQAPAQAAPAAPRVGTIGHVGDGPVTLTAAIAPLLAAVPAPAAVTNAVVECPECHITHDLGACATAAPAAVAGPRRATRAVQQLGAGDAVFAFASMLTALPRVVPFGSAAWATPGAELATAFNAANGLSVSLDFPSEIVFPKVDGDLLAVIEKAAAPQPASPSYTHADVLEAHPNGYELGMRQQDRATKPAPAAQGDALDAARLDWLENDVGCRVFHLGKSWYTRANFGMPYHKRASLREAIDAARAAQEGK